MSGFDRNIAVKFSLLNGFEEIDIRETYYSDGEDAVVMSRKVD